MCRIRYIVSISVVIALMMTLLSGCAGESSNESIISGVTDPDSDYYSSSALSVELNDNSAIVNCFRCGDTICAVVSSSDNGNREYELMSFSPDPFQLLSRVKMDVRDSWSFCPVGETYIAAATYEGYRLFDKNTGELVRCSDGIIDYDNDNPVVASLDDGFAYITSTRTYRFDNNGDPVDEFQYDSLGWFSPYGTSCWQQDGECYVIAEDSIVYHLDLKQGKVTEKGEISDIRGDQIGYGGLYYDWRDGNIYEMTFNTLESKLCSYGSHIMVRPSSYTELFEDQYFFLDKDHYILTYSYPDGLYDINYICKDDALNIEAREKIVVKGYNAVKDKSLQYAAYLYNTEQDDYYVVIEEYGEDYGYSDAIEAQDSKMRLLHEFSSGNMPDIYYGNGFDYVYMGNSGIVIDMADLVADSQEINRDLMIPNMYDLMVNNGHCYQLFNGYRVNGLFVKKELADSITGDLRIFNDPAVSDGMRNYYLSTDIVDFAIRYPCRKLLNNGRFISREDIEPLLENAYDIGMSSSDKYANGNVVTGGDEDLQVRQLIIGSLTLYALEEESWGDFEFIGYPTINDTAYTIDPNSLVAISSGAEHPEACFEFIEYLYSDPVQETVLDQEQLPVKKTIFDRYVDSMSNPESIPEDDYTYKFLAYGLSNAFFPPIIGTQTRYYQLSEESVRGFKNMVYSVDTVNTMDWGMYNIIAEEVESHYLQGKTIPEVAESLHNRLLLYVQENY